MAIEKSIRAQIRMSRPTGLEIGRDEVRDARSWDLVRITEFTSIQALRAYQHQLQHLAVMAFNGPFVTHVASVDFTRTER